MIRIIGNIEISDHDQGTKEWHESRAGKITGTRLEAIIPTYSAKGIELDKSKEKRENLICTLIYEKIAPLQDIYQSDIMARGHLIESVVKELYTGRNIESVGFLKRLDNEYIGLSPDGIEIIDGQIKHAIEVKGPMGKNLIKYWLMDLNEIPYEYFYQVVMYFVVIDTLETLDFIIHNPEPYDANVRTKIIRVTREELATDIQRAEIAIFEFQAEWTTILKKFIENVTKHSTDRGDGFSL